jgi:hypothetical protein
MGAQIPANPKTGRGSVEPSFTANHATGFFLVRASAVGMYSLNAEAGTTTRHSG